MIYKYVFIFLLGSFQLVNAQEKNGSESEVIEFSNYMSDISSLDGMFDGVLEYCKQYISDSMAERSASKWEDINGVYISAVNDALHTLVEENVSDDRKEFVIQSLKENINGWYQGSYNNNGILTNIKKSQNKSISCANNLGVMNSHSFDIKNMIPQAYSLWQRKLKKS